MDLLNLWKGRNDGQLYIVRVLNMFFLAFDLTSAADPWFSSRIPDPESGFSISDPGSRILISIPDPGFRFASLNLQRIKYFQQQKIAPKLWETYMIRIFSRPDSGSRGKKSAGSGIPDPDPQ